MYAVQVDRPGPISSLVVRSVDEPHPARGEVKIAFLASSINPADVKIRTGAVVPRVGNYPYTLGYDLVGDIVEVDGEVKRFAPGARVLAMSAVALTGRGTWAEYVCLPEASVAELPQHMDVAAMARLPLVGLTAVQAVRRAAVVPGETVLVAGAAGAIGRILVQLLRHRGCVVRGLVRRPEHVDNLPTGDGFAADTRLPPPGSVDVVIDAAGGDFSAALTEGGRYVSLVPDQAPAREVLEARSITRAVILTRESGTDLAELVDLVETGGLTLETPCTFPLRRVREAHVEYEQNGQRNAVLVRD